jgi:hypothetical protein
VGGYYGGVAGAIIGYKAQNNPRAQSLAITVASIGCGGYAPVCAGAGQAALATSYGASESQAWNVGARAGATAWVFQLAGEVTPNDPSSWARYGAHAAAGCVTSAGHCSQGAAAAVLGKWVTNNTRDWGAGIAQGTAAAVAGGVGSVIAGGKFENGARTAAFGYLFNHCASSKCTFFEKAQAFFKGQWSIVEGTSDAVRFAARGTGLMGAEEQARWAQESQAVDSFVKRYNEDPTFALQVNEAAIKQGATFDLKNTNGEMKAWLLGRAITGTVTGFGPAAFIGGMTRQVENGHNVVDAVIKGGILGK